MRILVACEFSGVVRNVFSELGHVAWSCDLLPSESDGNHYTGDISYIINDGWDMMIAHPPCTYLCSSGLHWNKRRPERAKQTEEALEFVQLLLDAPIERIALENPVGCISTRIRKYDQAIHPWMFGDDASKKTCLWLKGLPMLNYTKVVPPNGWGIVRTADMYSPCELCGEPFCEEHNEHYADCPCYGPHQDDILTYKRIDGFDFAMPQEKYAKPVWSNQTPSGQNKLGPSPDRWKKRATTYQGIANAMAEQWSIFC